MLAIIDSRSPQEAIDNLKKHADAVFQFQSEGITENSISGHPDIFIYQDETNLIVAPNAPLAFVEFLSTHNVNFVVGERKVGETFETSVGYNCLSTSKYFFHKSGFTDTAILKLNSEKEFIDLPQAYTRCSLTHLGNNCFISSDKGIEKKLLAKGLDCFWFAPEEISIIDHKHGFVGGTNGLCNNKIYFNGNIDLHKQGSELRKYIENTGLEIVSLSNDLLYDGGGIFFIEQ